jgi:hypothetical protein
MNELRWLRVVIAAFLIEVGLTVTTVPILLLVGEQAFVAAVPVACVVVPFVVACLATRKLPAARVLHALLMGIVATVMYFALVIGTASIAEAAAAYGLALFIVVNGLRVVSAAAGGYVADRSRPVPSGT